MTINTLQVLWIDEDRRERHPIGVLRREAGRYHYEYRDLSKASEHGFGLLPEFPDATRVYTSPKLFATFAERLPDSRRSDRARIFSDLGLSDPADEFDILARSGGTLATDRVELAEERSIGDTFERPLVFQIRGTQYHPQPDDRPLLVGETLRILREPDNKWDADACVLLREDGLRAGFVPKAYSTAVAAAHDAGRSLVVVLLRSVLLPRQQPPTGSEPTWMAELRSQS